jgi:hypothetical protein
MSALGIAYRLLAIGLYLGAVMVQHVDVRAREMTSTQGLGASAMNGNKPAPIRRTVQTASDSTMNYAHIGKQLNRRRRGNNDPERFSKTIFRNGDHRSDRRKWVR